MDNTQIVTVVIIVVLISSYFLLKRKNKQHSEANLPAVSEDVNLPVANKDELENKGPQ